jgi:hypothetical protein
MEPNLLELAALITAVAKLIEAIRPYRHPQANREINEAPDHPL